MTELLFPWVGLLRVFYQTLHLPLVGDAVLYPSFPFALIPVTALSGIHVQNSSDVVGKNVCVCIISVTSHRDVSRTVL